MKPFILASLIVGGSVCHGQDSVPVLFPGIVTPLFNGTTEHSPISFDFTFPYNPDHDSIPLLLIIPPSPDPFAIIIYPPSWPEPWPPYEYPWPIIAWDFDWSLLVWVAPVCGDSFHPNGQLSSRIECVDSVMHGKAIYWDETGHKTTENTYFEGHCTKTKVYDSRGRITSLAHYDYAGNYDGICIDYDYDNNSKIVTHYEHGLKHGLYQSFYEEVIGEEIVYDHDTLIEKRYFYTDGKLMQHDWYSKGGNQLEYKDFHENGQLDRHEKWNNDGAKEFSRRWDYDGILIQEELYVDGKPHGDWLIWFDRQTNVKELGFFNNGDELRRETWTMGVLTGKKEVKNQRLFYEMQQTITGQLLFEKQYDSTGVSGTERRWDENGILVLKKTTTYRVNNGGLLYTGENMERIGDTIFVYSAASNPDSKVPIERWVVYNDNTLRMDYVTNNPNEAFPNALCSNYFQYDASQDEYLRQGVWKFYENNKLSKVLTYKSGKADGPAVVYDISADLPVVASKGSYLNDLKHGQWVEFDSVNNFVFTYANGVKEGDFIMWDSLGVKICSGIYSNDLLNGQLLNFYPNEMIKSTGLYVDGKKEGRWIYFNENGELILEGEYENDERIKTWLEYTPSDKKKPEKTKISYS